MLYFNLIYLLLLLLCLQAMRRERKRERMAHSMLKWRRAAYLVAQYTAQKQYSSGRISIPLLNFATTCPLAERFGAQVVLVFCCLPKDLDPIPSDCWGFELSYRSGADILSIVNAGLKFDEPIRGWDEIRQWHIRYRTCVLGCGSRCDRTALECAGGMWKYRAWPIAKRVHLTALGYNDRTWRCERLKISKKNNLVELIRIN